MPTSRKEIIANFVRSHAASAKSQIELAKASIQMAVTMMGEVPTEANSVSLTKQLEILIDKCDELLPKLENTASEETERKIRWAFGRG